MATSGALTPQASVSQGLAYNFGSPFTVSIPPAELATLAPSGTPTTGSVVITAGATTITVTIKLYVEPTSALINSISPAILPTASAGSTYTVAIGGSGFVTSGSPTVAGIVPSGSTVLVVDPNIQVSVQDTTSIVLTITVPSNPDPYLPFGGAGGSVTLAVCNPQSGNTVCSVPAAGGTATLTIGINPIISAVTSASSYVQATAPNLPNVAPYDILSIFGMNFCVSGGTGCIPASSTAVLYGAMSQTTFAYPLSLSPDSATVANPRNLAVNFYQHGTQTLIGTAPLLFANNTQINLLAPSALVAKEGSTVDIVVSFGYATGATMLKSLPYTVNVVATNPGVFTVGGDGEGSAAALATGTYALITNSAPAIARTNVANSDVVQLYVTGLGVPDSTFNGTGGGGSGLSATCMKAIDYFANVQSATSASPAVTTDDGLVMESAFYDTGAMEPCFLVAGNNLPSVAIGGQPAVVQWAGWVSGAVAGLYQINVQLPSSTPTLPGGAAAWTYASNNISGHVMGTDVVSLPVVVTAGTKTSQAGANLYVEQGLLATVTCSACGAGVFTAPAGAITSNPVYTVTIAHGTALPAITVVGAQGAAASPSYGFLAGASTGSVSGLALSAFPDDLAVDPASGILSGHPGNDANGLNIEIAVTDATSGLTGNVIISFVIT